MRYLFIVIISVGLTFFYGCTSLFADKQEVISSYSLIYSIFLTKEEEQKFIDKGTEVLFQLKENSSYKVNVEELKMLLANAIEENKRTEKSLSYTKAVDGDFGFKEKADKYVAVLTEVNLGAFTEFIKVLESDMPDKYTQCVQVLEPAIFKLRKVAKEFEAAGDAIVNTYGIRHERI